jgi:hypothetical protein
MVVYDQVFVINSTETEAKSVINGDDIQCKYPLRDIHNRLRNTTIKFNVYAEYMSSYGTSTRVYRDLFRSNSPRWTIRCRLTIHTTINDCIQYHCKREYGL